VKIFKQPLPFEVKSSSKRPGGKCRSEVLFVRRGEPEKKKSRSKRKFLGGLVEAGGRTPRVEGGARDALRARKGTKVTAEKLRRSYRGGS